MGGGLIWTKVSRSSKEVPISGGVGGGGGGSILGSPEYHILCNFD